MVWTCLDYAAIARRSFLAESLEASRFLFLVCFTFRRRGSSIFGFRRSFRYRRSHRDELPFANPPLPARHADVLRIPQA